MARERRQTVAGKRFPTRAVPKERRRTETRPEMSIEVDFEIVSVSSQDADHPAENLANGLKKGWRVARGPARGRLEIKWASPIHLNSVRVAMQDSPVSVVIFAIGAAGERGSYVGGGSMQARSAD